MHRGRKGHRFPRRASKAVARASEGLLPPPFWMNVGLTVLHNRFPRYASPEGMSTEGGKATVKKRLWKPLPGQKRRMSVLGGRLYSLFYSTSLPETTGTTGDSEKRRQRPKGPLFPRLPDPIVVRFDPSPEEGGDPGGGVNHLPTRLAPTEVIGNADVSICFRYHSFVERDGAPRVGATLFPRLRGDFGIRAEDVDSSEREGHLTVVRPRYLYVMFLGFVCLCK